MNSSNAFVSFLFISIAGDIQYTIIVLLSVAAVTRAAIPPYFSFIYTLVKTPLRYYHYLHGTVFGLISGSVLIASLNFNRLQELTFFHGDFFVLSFAIGIVWVLIEKGIASNGKCENRSG